MYIPLFFSCFQCPSNTHLFTQSLSTTKTATYLIVYFLILKSWPLKSMFTRFTSLTSFLLLENAPSPRMLLLTSLIECIVQKRGQTTLLSEISKDDIFIGKSVVYKCLNKLIANVADSANSFPYPFYNFQRGMSVL